MQYEGKLYGKVAGKYIELDTHAEIERLQKRIAELDARLKESGRIMAQLAEAAEDDGVDGVRWRAIAGDAYDFINAPEGYADD